MTPLAGLILRILSLIMLYAFLGIAVWLLWRAVSAKESSAGRLTIPTISLVSDEDGIREELNFNSQKSPSAEVRNVISRWLITPSRHAMDASISTSINGGMKI